MKRDELNLLDAIDNSQAGLISLDALKKATAQLPTVKRTSRVTFGSCGPPSSNKRSQEFALKPAVVAR